MVEEPGSRTVDRTADAPGAHPADLVELLLGRFPPIQCRSDPLVLRDQDDVVAIDRAQRSGNTLRRSRRPGPGCQIVPVDMVRPDLRTVAGALAPEVRHKEGAFI